MHLPAGHRTMDFFVALGWVLSLELFCLLKSWKPLELIGRLNVRLRARPHLW